MTDWREFENDCCEYLQGKYGRYASFTHEGGADPTKPDILVNTNSGDSFYIEAKDCPAQCGQFVLIPNVAKQKFEFSSKNATSYNEMAEMICNFMNDHFEYFKEAGTAGKDIVMSNSQEVFSKWIIKKYSDENVKYFITNNHRMYRVKDFAEAFLATAKYRIKRSGSTSVGTVNIPKVHNYLIAHYPSISDVILDGGKMFVRSFVNLHEERFVLDKYEYMISERDKPNYEIRRLSNTFNANVIFSIDETKNIPSMTFDEIVNELINNYYKF